MSSPGQPLDTKDFLANIGSGRTISIYRKNQRVFSQGDAADSVFYIQKGKVKVTVISTQGKEAVIAILGKDEFCGEGCLAGQPRRFATAAAVTECEIMRLEKETVIRTLHDEPAFSEMFVSHVLARTIRVEEDLVDHLFNSSEKRLARALLLLANFGKEGTPEPIIAKGEPGNARRDDRHHTAPRELLFEQVPEIGLHQLQRENGSPQLIAGRCPARSTADQEKEQNVTRQITIYR